MDCFWISRDRRHTRYNNDCNGRFHCLIYILSADASISMVLHWSRISRFRYLDCSIRCIYKCRELEKKESSQHIPIFSFFATGIFVLLFFGTLGVTYEVLTLIPWAFGWTETVNVMLSRTFFWSFGHTLVNVWYLTAVSAWYVVIPKIIGGRLFSDTLTRVVVILLVILNIPGGFHHQIVDPGFSEELKFLHVFMSLSIGFPSLMTAFAMFAIFENAGRRKGGKGLLGWFKKLPRGDVRFLAPFIAMVAFIPAGAGGIAQTNFQLNQVVHNRSEEHTSKL